jgi:cell division transport system ATP-binding protein
MNRFKSVDSPRSDRGPLVRLTGVDAGYGATIVLIGLDFEAHAGEVALITGPAAAGKTSLTHLLRLALPPRAGRAFVLSVDVDKASARVRADVKRRIGYVAENPVFVEQWSAAENIALPLKMAGLRPAEYNRDVRELVDFVGLSEAADLPIEQLSGAEKRRAAIARALASKPQLILADDPTAGMSPSDGRRVVKLLAEMRRVGAGVVIASQDETLVDCAPFMHWRIARGHLARAELSASEAAGAAE